MATTVRDDAARSRYEIALDGELVGFAEYRLTDQVAMFPHTEIDPRFGGRGLATQLIREALDDVRSRGLAVEPYCSFVRDFIAKNPDYLPLVRKEDRGRFDLERD